MKDRIEQSTMQKFKVKKSKFGKGCFANEIIRKNEFICILIGKETTWEESEKRYKDGKIRIDDPFQISEAIYMELYKPYRYFNHSCNPNSGIRGKNELIAIKNIRKDDEITLDYSTAVWDDRWAKKYGNWTMKCECEEKNCRMVIGDFLSLPISQRRIYINLGIVPDFILEKLDKMNR
jgi:uncharacterized protein